MLQKLGNGWLTASRSEIDLAGVFAELRSILHREADYRLESTSQRRFAELLKDDPRFVVPQSLPELSTTRVHTMTWEGGQALGEWLKSAPARAERLWLAQLLLELYCLEFFRWGLVQTIRDNMTAVMSSASGAVSPVKVLVVAPARQHT